MRNRFVADLPPEDSRLTQQTPAESRRKQNGGHTRLLKGIILAIVIGTAVGGWFPDLAARFAILGDLFLNALMMIVVPLVMFSMIVGITGLGDIRNLGSIGRRTVLYYLLTTGISVLIGIVLVNIVHPGRGISPGESHPGYTYEIGGEDGRTVTLSGASFDRTRYDQKYTLILLDQGVSGTIELITETRATVRLWEIREGAGDLFYLRAEDGTLLPFRRIGGELVSTEPELAPAGTGVEITLAIAGRLRGKEGRDVAGTLEEVLLGDAESGKQGMIPRNVFSAMARMDILPLIIFSLLIGAALSVLGARARPAIDIIATLDDAVMRLVHWIMAVAPIGIFGLIAARISRAGGFEGFLPELEALGKYSFTVLLGLAVHGLVILPLILKIVGRRRIGAYSRGMGAALLNAFSTASSSATLPLTMQGVEEENGISNRTSSFVLPLGATINMDGTALYEAVAAIFIAQVYGIPLSPALQTIIFLTATLAAIGAAGIPEAGLVTMVIVLRAVDLPVEGIGLLLTIDWLLDRFRTTVNVWGDSVGAGVIETLEMRDRPKT
jgi:Na+/H+-dicarboxylate symporter